jgi:hypothetical protein
MGWKQSMFRSNLLRTLGTLCLLGLTVLGSMPKAHAQDDPPLLSIALEKQPYGVFILGRGTDVNGGMGLITGDFQRSIFQRSLVRAPALGTWLYVRVDGGRFKQGGSDYIWGDRQQALGTDWDLRPIVVGSHLEATWTSGAMQGGTTGGGGGTGGGPGGGGGNGGGGGGGNTAARNPFITIKLVASFVHEILRLEFQVTNNDPLGIPHSVELAFLGDVNASPTSRADGPIRIANVPYLYNETELIGSFVPSVWEAFDTLVRGTETTPPVVHSARAILRPRNSTGTEPTVPQRIVYARTVLINGNTGTTRIPELAWQYRPDPAVILGRATGAEFKAASVVQFYAPMNLQPLQKQRLVVHIGQSNSTIDPEQTIALGARSPQTLTYVKGAASPAPFVINGIVQNMTDLQRFGGQNSGPVNLTLNLPKGLTLAPNSRPLTQQIDNLAPSEERGVAWTVMADGTANGKLTYTVAMSSSFDLRGKLVQRSIEVPAPVGVDLMGTDATGNRYTMVSVPLVSGIATPAEFFGIPTADFKLQRWDPGAGGYPEVTSLSLGNAYWMLYKPTTTKRVQFATKFTPMEEQIKPTGNLPHIPYARGWNQIGNPYLYGIRFSEIQIFNTETQEIVTMDEAAEGGRGWILPILYYYDTSDANPVNWTYRIVSNLGETMVPYRGYWMLVRRRGLEMIFPGVDAPGASITRSAKVGVGIGMANNGVASNNWKLRLAAKSTDSADTDNFIGVASGATDKADNFKAEKPPVMNPTVALSILQSDNGKTRLAYDMRSPALARKTWELQVSTPKPNSEVTVSWPEISTSVPRDYNLVLVDKETNTRRTMRNTTTYAFKTGESGTRNFQIIAEPTRGAGRMRITTFDVAANAPVAGRSASSVTINYALSQDAQMQVTIRDGRGRTVRTLNNVTRAANNSGNVIWDFRDQSGTVLPGGVYNVELNAQTEDGQRDRRVQPYILTR